MLEVLRRLIQDVNAADSLEDALALIVAQVRAAMRTDVCTIYLHDKATQKLVFRATEGLNSEKVGQFGLGFDEGLGRLGCHPRRTFESGRCQCALPVSVG